VVQKFSRTQLALLIFTVLSGCATARNEGTNGTSSPPLAPTITSPAETNPSDPATTASDASVDWEPALIPNDLRYAVSQWIAENPDAEFEEIARQANRSLWQLGYPHRLDVAHLLTPNSNDLVLRSENRRLVFRVGEEIAQETDFCGERFLTISALPNKGKTLWMISENRRIPVDLSRTRWEQFRLLKKGKYLRTIIAPEPTEPLGITPDGRAIYIRFPLYDRLVHDWWHKLGNQLTPLFDEEPFLVLRVSKNRIYFEEDIKHLIPQEFEVERTKGSILRWRFQPSDITIELDGHCRTS
jgi:hypothetical protein